VAHSNHGIFISQQNYVFVLLAKTGKLGRKPVETPVEETPVEQNQNVGESVKDVAMDRQSYQKLLVRKLI